MSSSSGCLNLLSKHSDWITCFSCIMLEMNLPFPYISSGLSCLELLSDGCHQCITVVVDIQDLLHELGCFYDPWPLWVVTSVKKYVMPFQSLYQIKTVMLTLSICLRILKFVAFMVKWTFLHPCFVIFNLGPVEVLFLNKSHLVNKLVAVWIWLQLNIKKLFPFSLYFSKSLCYVVSVFKLF